MAAATGQVLLHEVADGEGRVVWMSRVQYGLCALELAGVGAAVSVGCCDQSSLAKVIFGLEILDLGFVGAVENPDGNREDGVALSN